MAVAVVGSGLTGFSAYQALRRSGLAPAEITVFGPDEDPAGAFRRRAAAIRQRTMRSESDGHCLPASFPGLAVISARRRRTPLPLLASALGRYHPSLAEFLAHVERLRERSGWRASLVPTRIEQVSADAGGFMLDAYGPFRHVLLAPGPAGLNVPAQLRGDPRVVHSYEPHRYASTVTVVGAGLAAASEWLNALAAGAEVVSVRRREPLRQALNIPREYFSRRGLAGYHRLSAAERAARLRVLLAPSYPRGAVWDRPLAQAVAEGRFRVEQNVNGSEQVICATGFRRGFQHDQLLARLVAEHRLETVEGWIVLDPDGTVAALSDASRTLALTGAPAQWAFPGADTLAGARYLAHGFVRRVGACRTR